MGGRLDALVDMSRQAVQTASRAAEGVAAAAAAISSNLLAPAQGAADAQHLETMQDCLSQADLASIYAVAAVAAAALEVEPMVAVMVQEGAVSKMKQQLIRCR